MTEPSTPAPPATALVPGLTRAGLAREAHIAFFITLVAVVTLLAWPHREADVTSGELRTAGGSAVSLESRLAPVTLIHFWSTWCPPCITETPSIQRLASDFADDERFRLLLVAVADDTEAAVEFLGDAQATYFDPDWAVAHGFDTRKLPETHLLVDGDVVESFIGAQNWDDPSLRAKIADAIGRAG